MKLAWGPGFQRAFKRRTRNQPDLQKKIFAALDKLADDPFQSSLLLHDIQELMKRSLLLLTSGPMTKYIDRTEHPTTRF